MRRFGRWLGRLLLALAAVCSLAYLFGPYERVDLAAQFEPRKFGEGVQVYFESIESAFEDITEGVEKRVIWAGQQEVRTPLSLVYIHGFSATSEEIRPVPDRLAAALGANLVYTRLTGHGRGGTALAEARVSDWMHDTVEALAAARAVGDEVVVLGTSTGGTLAALAMLDDAQQAKIKGIVFVSPNFGINDPMAPLLTMPAARYILPLVAGHERSWKAANGLQEKYWTTRYPTVAVFPLAALVKEAASASYSALSIPALFHYALDDRVVDGAASARVSRDWGGAVTEAILPEDAKVGASRHVIAGDIISPAQTAATTEIILNWIKGL